MALLSHLVVTLGAVTLVLTLLGVGRVDSANQQTQTPTVLPGLWNLQYCQSGHHCLANETCVQLNPRCRPGVEHCRRLSRRAHRFCTPAGSISNGSFHTAGACSALCGAGQSAECRRPVISLCTGSTCVTNAVVAKCKPKNCKTEGCSVVGPASVAPFVQVRDAPGACLPCVLVNKAVQFLKGNPVCQFEFAAIGRVRARNSNQYTVEVIDFFNLTQWSTYTAGRPYYRTIIHRRHPSQNTGRCACPMLEVGGLYMVGGRINSNDQLVIRSGKAAALKLSRPHRPSIVAPLKTGLQRKMEWCQQSALESVFEEVDSEGNPVAGATDAAATELPSATSAPEAPQSAVATVGRHERSVAGAPLRVYHARIAEMTDSELWENAVKVHSAH